MSIPPKEYEILRKASDFVYSYTKSSGQRFLEIKINNEDYTLFVVMTNSGRNGIKDVYVYQKYGHQVSAFVGSGNILPEDIFDAVNSILIKCVHSS